MPNEIVGNNRKRMALQGLGVAGFLFFLIKGLMWLLVPVLLTYFGTR